MWLLANYKWMKDGSFLNLVIRKRGNDKQSLESEASIFLPLKKIKKQGLSKLQSGLK